MRFLFIVGLVLSTLFVRAQGGGQGVAAGAWEPRNYVRTLDLRADWNPAQPSYVTLNGDGASELLDRTWVTGRTENLLVQSETFATTWGRTRINAFGATDTGATNAGSFANTARTLDPLGGNTADFIQEDATASNSHYVHQTSQASAGSYFLHCWIKPDGRDWVQFQIESGADIVRCSFNVTSGTVGTAVNTGGATGATGSMTAAANGFFLCSLAGTLTTSGSYVSRICIAEADNDLVFTGNSTSGLFLWGAQLRRATSSSAYAATIATAIDSRRFLTNGTAANQPIYDTTNTLNGGATLLFNGTTHYFKSPPMADLVQPETVVAVLKQVTWTSADVVFDGNGASSMAMAQRTNTPALSLNAGTITATNGDLAIDVYGATTAIFNGASSSLQINKGTPITGDAGAGNGAGLTIASAGVAGSYANIQVARILLTGKVHPTNELTYLQHGPLKMVGAK